eukprot:531307_1
MTDSCLLPKVDIEKADSRIICLVYGYIRCIEQSLGHTIPDEIVLICLSFYYSNEYFALAAEHYKIDHESKRIEKTERAYDSSAFGNRKIPSHLGGIYVWTFEILYRDTSMYIGITSDHDKIGTDLWKNTVGTNCCLSTTGTKVKNNKRKSYSSGFDKGDVIKMELDLDHKRLIYHSKGTGSKIAFEIPCGPSIAYQMAISFLNAKSKIELIDFGVK